MIDIDSMDKSSFVCLQLKDESVYFGEVIYMNEDNVFFDPKTTKDAASKGKPQRHGFGIQLFGTTSDNYLCKYEGYWDKDRQHGYCRCSFPDKATYEGNMKYNAKDGSGKYIWANGDEYNGSWKNNRFEGSGSFKHHDGNVLSGIFKNNYFTKTHELYVNPFLSTIEIQNFIAQKNKIALMKQNNKKQKFFFFEKVSTVEEVIKLMKKSNDNQRIPLVMSSKQLGSSISEVFNQVQQICRRPWCDFDLRQAYLLKKTNPEQFKQLMTQTKRGLSNVLVKGEQFVINLDDSSASTYEEIFYPDIREFYSASSLPSQIWDLDLLKRHEVYEKVIADTENHLKMALASDYIIAAWSKHKIDQNEDNKVIIEEIERRFSSIIPIIKIDIVLLVDAESRDSN